MYILWRYLKPQRAWIALALLLAAASQVLALVDPIIFGWIIDDYAIDRAGKTDEGLVSGVLRLLALAVAVAVLSRLAKAFQDDVTRLVVWVALFDDAHVFSEQANALIETRGVRIATCPLIENGVTA